MSECNLAKIVIEILSGKVMVFPTETSYAIGCDATNQAAVDRIFDIKGREGNKPLLIVVDSTETAKKYLHWSENLQKLADKYWPGAVTVVGESIEDHLAKGVIKRDGTVGLRVSAYPLLKSITEKIGRPLVATSANIAGEENLYDAKKIIEVFFKQKNQPDIILDYGMLPTKPPTTVVSVIGDDIKILRQGELLINLN